MSDTLSPTIGNKRDAAKAAGVSVPTLDRLIEKFPDFPIVQRGTNGREYQFDLAAVIAFMARVRADAEREAREKAEFLEQLDLPIGAAPDLPEGIKPSEALAAAKLRALQRKEALESGLLVPTTQVRQALTAAFASLNRRLNATVTQIARAHALPEPVLRDMQARLHEAQRAFVAEAGAFSAAAPDSPELPLAA